jgi:hypothetical protein
MEEANKINKNILIMNFDFFLNCFKKLFY